MCKNCKGSELGKRRQSALDTAITQCKTVDINPGTGGFLARHAWKGYTPQFTPEQRAALDAYNQTQQDMKSLHNDYVFGLARIGVQARKEGMK